MNARTPAVSESSPLRRVVHVLVDPASALRCAASRADDAWGEVGEAARRGRGGLFHVRLRQPPLEHAAVDGAVLRVHRPLGDITNIVASWWRRRAPAPSGASKSSTRSQKEPWESDDFFQEPSSLLNASHVSK